MLRLHHGKIPKVVSPRFTTLKWGRGGDEVCSVNVHRLSNLGWISLKGFVQDCSSLLTYQNTNRKNPCLQYVKNIWTGMV